MPLSPQIFIEYHSLPGPGLGVWITKTSRTQYLSFWKCHFVPLRTSLLITNRQFKICYPLKFFNTIELVPTAVYPLAYIINREIWFYNLLSETKNKNWMKTNFSINKIFPKPCQQSDEPWHGCMGARQKSRVVLGKWADLQGIVCNLVSGTATPQRCRK